MVIAQRSGEVGDRFPRRLWIFASILAVENTAVVQLPHPWFVIYLYRGVPLAFGLALLFFGRAALRASSMDTWPANRVFAALHIAALAAFAGTEWCLGRFAEQSSSALYQVGVWFWLALIPALVYFLAATLIPMRRWRSLGAALGPAWVYAGLCSGLLILIRERMRLSWDGSSTLAERVLQESTFGAARAVLHLFYGVVISDAPSHVLGTDRFLVVISGTCSGIEGLALISSLMLVWFLFAWRELRVARALLLVPVALALMWLLNLLRLVMLIAIGDAGHPVVAINGFHSEAGWIAFILVSLGFLLVVQRMPWFLKEQTCSASSTATLQPRGKASSRNVAAIYLAPFLAITAAAVVSQATAGHFEWLYPLRFAAAIAVFWIYRAEYKRMQWQFGTLSVLAGLVVAAMWVMLQGTISAAHTSDSRSNSIAVGLATLPAGGRAVWILFRVLAATVTVPLAEEVAFRGFLARRLMSAEVEAVSYARLSPLAIAGSSIAFGLMHGHMWLAGTFAGLVFACLAKWRGRLGDAVAAHATANLALSFAVLFRHDYSLW